MIIVVGEVRFSAGTIDRLRPVLTRLIEAARAIPGCLHYAHGVDLLEPDLLIVSQRWADAEAMGLHYVSPAMMELSETVDDSTIVEMSIRAYTADYLRTMLEKVSG